jgi:glycosyltransferase involved in cell wall biosynthesis
MPERVRSWAILTPEYPPDSGGIGDYVELVARRLAERGDEVTVFTRSPPGRVATPGVRVELLPDDFGAATERLLDAAFRALPQDAVVLVQYVPHGFRRRGMNVPFARFLGARRERLWLMVHEVAYPFSRRHPPHHWVLALVTRLMLRLVTSNVERVFVSTPAWEQVLGTWGSTRVLPEWLPIPATIGPDPAAMVAPEPSGPTPQTVAHFGTYGEVVAKPLELVLVPLLTRRTDISVVLLGGGSERFRARLLTLVPSASARVRATGRVPPEVIAQELAGAGAALFPYLDGATTRRTGLMAALAVGAAIVAIGGGYSESFWRTAGVASLYPYDQPEAAVAALERLLAEPELRAVQRQRARELYRERFGLDHVVDQLQRLHPAAPQAIRAPVARARSPR